MPIMMAKYEIVSVPQGGAPLWVREAWPGIIVNGFTGFPVEGDFRNVATNERVEAYDGIHVLKYEAYGALREAGKLEALDWWQKNSPPISMYELLVFRKDELRRISEPEVMELDDRPCGHPPSPEDQDRYDSKDDCPF